MDDIIEVAMDGCCVVCTWAGQIEAGAVAADDAGRSADVQQLGP